MPEQLKLTEDAIYEKVMLADIEPVEPSKNGYKALVDSVRKLGVQTPVTLRQPQKDDEPYIVVAGRRRIAAARECGYERIDAMIYPSTVDPNFIPVTTITENRVRADNIATEVASVLELSENGWSQEDITNQTGIPKAKVNEYLTMLKLPAELVDGIVDGAIASTTAKELVKLKPTALKRAVDLYAESGKLTGQHVHDVKQVQVQDAGQQVTLPQLPTFSVEDFFPEQGGDIPKPVYTDPMESPAFVAMKADATERFEREEEVKALLKGERDAEIIVRKLRKLYGIPTPRKSRSKAGAESDQPGGTGEVTALDAELPSVGV